MARPCALVSLFWAPWFVELWRVRGAMVYLSSLSLYFHRC